MTTFFKDTNVVVVRTCVGRAHYFEDNSKIMVHRGLVGSVESIIGEWVKVRFNDPLEWDDGELTTQKYGLKRTNTVWLRSMDITRKFEG